MYQVQVFFIIYIYGTCVFLMICYLIYSLVNNIGKTILETNYQTPRDSRECFNVISLYLDGLSLMVASYRCLPFIKETSI